MPNQYTRPIPLAERFWSKVAIANPDECWVWQAGLDNKGYGRFAARLETNQSPNQIASRIAYMLTHGSIQKSDCVLHRCDNPPCCNPAHLFLGTLKDNTQDMWRKGRHMPMPGRFKPGDHVGEKNSHAKITARDVVQIRVDVANGVKSRVLAQQYGLAQATIRGIVTKKIWKHVA